MKKNQAKENTLKHFEESAKYYDESFEGKFVKRMYEPLLEELLKEEDGTVLDVGCGNGNILLQLVNGKRVLYGVDFSDTMVDECKKKLGDNAQIMVADAEHLPFSDGTIDTLLCNASFHHYIHPAQVLREMKRILKPNGKLFIGESYVIQPLRAIMNFSFRFSDSGDVRCYGKKEMYRLLKANGFGLKKTKKTNRYTILYMATVKE